MEEVSTSGRSEVVRSSVISSTTLGCFALGGLRKARDVIRTGNLGLMQDGIGCCKAQSLCFFGTTRPGEEVCSVPPI